MSPHPPELYHYTCHHAARGIRAKGMVLMPAPQPFLRELPIVWATDMAEPIADALGLTSTILLCDRTVRRYQVMPRDREAFTWWPEWWPGRVDPLMASMLAYPPATPRRWWVAEHAVNVRELYRAGDDD